MQLHNHMFIYKPLINGSNSFTPNSFTKANKQQQYSLQEIRKTLLTLSVLYIYSLEHLKLLCALPPL